MVMDPIELSRKIRAALAPCSLGTWPTPVDTRPDLAPATGRAEFWLKREDLTSPRCGGNKVRGLEFLLAGLPAGMVCVTVGGLGSTHCIATAKHARDRDDPRPRGGGGRPRRPRRSQPISRRVSLRPVAGVARGGPLGAAPLDSRWGRGARRGGRPPARRARARRPAARAP